MRISRISIKNYRSCQLTDFEPDERLSALIGPNGSGKTNVLSAVRLLSSLVHTRRMRFRGEKPPTSASELKVWYDLDGNSIVHTVKLHLVTNENNQDEIIGTDETWNLFSVTGSRKKLKIPLEVLAELSQDYFYVAERNHPRGIFFRDFIRRSGIGTGAIDALKKVVNFVSGIKYYSASQFTNPGNCPISFEVEGESELRRGISITGHKRFLYDLYQEFRAKSEKYSEFMSIVGDEGIGLVQAIDFNEIQTSLSNYSVMAGGRVSKKEKINLLVIPSFEVSGNSLSPSQLSEGTFKTLALVFYLVTDNSSLLMIEEPEVCVHHGLLKSIVELIAVYSSEKQIFISTHSDAVLDSLNIENVFKVRRDKADGTKVSSISKTMRARELAALKDYLQNEGSLGEYWKHGDLENV